MTTRLKECAVELRFEKRSDGRTVISSPDLPGLHLVGLDPKALRADIDPAIRDMLRHGSNLAVDSIHRVASLGNLVGEFDAGLRREIRVVYLKPAD